jgi:hypothetical protein
MSYLYKRSNSLWRFLIRRRLVARVWRPLVEISRRRHLRFRARLAATPPNQPAGTAPVLVSAGV